MIDILREIRQHLINNDIVAAKQCKLNLVDNSNELVCLWLYGGYHAPVGSSKTVQIKVLNLDNVAAENLCKAIYAAIISEKPHRISTINNKKMKIVESQQPFFVEIDTQKRFVWAFNVTVTAF